MSAVSQAVAAEQVSARPSALASRLTLRLFLFLLLNAFALNALLWAVSPAPYKETVLQHSWSVLTGVGSDDSWGAMDAGLDHVREHPEVPLYSEIFFRRLYRFQYPPSALFALAGMQMIAPQRVQFTEVYTGAWPSLNTMFGWLFFAVMTAAVVVLFETGLRRARPDVDWRRLMALRIAVTIGLTLTFYPAVKAFTLGQIQVWINALFALGLLAWARGMKIPSGILIGLISLIKPHYALILAWALLRREMRFLLACAVTAGLGLAASVAVYGLANHIDYVRVVSFLSQHGEAYYPNQSVNGLLNRVMSLFDPQSYLSLDLPAGKFPPLTPWIYAVTVATSAAVIIAALAHRRREGDPGRVIDFATMGLSCTMASPLAWEHHYGITLPVYAVLLAANIGNSTRLIWLAASYVLLSTYVPATNLLAATPLNILQSTLFAGAVILLLLLHGKSGTDGGRQAEAAPPPTGS